VFRALADPTRLALLEHLIGMGEQNVSELAEAFELSMPAISRHLKVLREAGLIESRVDRQWRICRAKPDMFVRLHAWTSANRWFWSDTAAQAAVGS
jgi:DNA-binding transcriptional ArsR family regulator